jgi:hypothetical protein
LQRLYSALIGNLWLDTGSIGADIDLVSGPDHHHPMFEEQPSARADMAAGALYAITGEAGWIYYGQVMPEKKVGFFRRRDLELADPAIVLEAPIMSVVTVHYPSLTQAMRSGRWKKLGRFPLSAELTVPHPSVQWPVGTLDVTVWLGDRPHHDTCIDDPAIQDMELMAVWDAVEHIPARLTADFGAETAEWHVGGSIRRERQIREECARRFADQPLHELPTDWVPTTIR